MKKAGVLMFVLFSALAIDACPALAETSADAKQAAAEAYITRYLGDTEARQQKSVELQEIFANPVLRQTRDPITLWHGGTIVKSKKRTHPLWTSERKTSAAMYGPPSEIKLRAGQIVLDMTGFLEDHPERFEAVLFYKEPIADYAHTHGYDAVYFGLIRDLPVGAGKGDPHPTWVLMPGSWKQVR